MAKFKAGDPVWAISRAEYYLLPIGKYAGIVEVACSLQCYECYEVDVIGHPSSFDNSGLWHVAACDLEHGARGRLATAFVSEQKHPKIVSYQKFWGYVVKHQAYDLLQKRVASTAYYDRRENGERVPGVKTFRQTKISVRKAK